MSAHACWLRSEEARGGGRWCMNDFIKSYPSSPSSSEMFDGAALLFKRCPSYMMLYTRALLIHAFTKAHAWIQLCEHASDRENAFHDIPTDYRNAVSVLRTREPAPSVEGQVSIVPVVSMVLEWDDQCYAPRNDVGSRDEKSPVVINERRKLERRTRIASSRNIRIPWIISIPWR